MHHLLQYSCCCCCWWCWTSSLLVSRLNIRVVLKQQQGVVAVDELFEIECFPTIFRCGKRRIPGIHTRSENGTGGRFDLKIVEELQMLNVENWFFGRDWLDWSSLVSRVVCGLFLAALSSICFVFWRGGSGMDMEWSGNERESERTKQASKRWRKPANWNKPNVKQARTCLRKLKWVIGELRQMRYLCFL